MGFRKHPGRFANKQTNNGHRLVERCSGNRNRLHQTNSIPRTGKCPTNQLAMLDSCLYEE